MSCTETRTGQIRCVNFNWQTTCFPVAGNDLSSCCFNESTPGILAPSGSYMRTNIKAAIKFFNAFDVQSLKMSAAGFLQHPFNGTFYSTFSLLTFSYRTLQYLHGYKNYMEIKESNPSTTISASGYITTSAPTLTTTTSKPETTSLTTNSKAGITTATKPTTELTVPNSDEPEIRPSIPNVTNAEVTNRNTQDYRDDKVDSVDIIIASEVGGGIALVIVIIIITVVCVRNRRQR